MTDQIVGRDAGTMNRSLGRFVGLIGRSQIVGLVYALATIAGGLLAGVLALPTPAIGNQIDPSTMLAWRVVGGFMLALVLGNLSRHLEIPFADRTAVLFLLIFVINNLINLVEAVFFTTYFDAGVTGALMVMAVNAITQAGAIAFLFQPVRSRGQFGSVLSDFLGRRSWIAWVWRMGLAGLLYVPTYLVFGMLVYPFVGAYYEDPAISLGLRVPGIDVIVPLEIVRGLIFVLAVFPLVALLRVSRRLHSLWLVVTIAMLGAWEPLLMNPIWPVALRIAHALEITGDALVQGITIAWLLGITPSLATLEMGNQGESPTKVGQIA